MTLEEIYSAIPKIECKKLCADYCGPVLMTAGERDAMTKSLGVIPPLKEMTCGALCAISGTCNAYEARPMICRLWGTVARLRCPHGCKPERYLSHREEVRLMKAYLALKPVLPEEFGVGLTKQLAKLEQMKF